MIDAAVYANEPIDDKIAVGELRKGDWIFLDGSAAEVMSYQPNVRRLSVFLRLWSHGAERVIERPATYKFRKFVIH